MSGGTSTEKQPAEKITYWVHLIVGAGGLHFPRFPANFFSPARPSLRSAKTDWEEIA